MDDFKPLQLDDSELEKMMELSHALYTAMGDRLREVPDDNFSPPIILMSIVNACAFASAGMFVIDAFPRKSIEGFTQRAAKVMHDVIEGELDAHDGHKKSTKH